MFEEVARTIAYKKGIPAIRFVFVPHPVAGRSEAVHRAYVEGNDPVSGKPVAQELIDVLTRPLSMDEQETDFIERDVARLVESDSPKNLHRLFLESGWTDGLPIVLPTEARVKEMLKGTNRQPDEIVGTMAPSSPHEAWQFTVEKVAVNAVMAGAEPEYLPVILAIASTGKTCLFSSTTSFARMVVVNGPVAARIGMNAGTGALGPLNHANSTIGRAWGLISRNLGGGGVIGKTYLGSQGNSLNYNNVCFPENETESPWEPFHVQMGFKADESVVSIFHGWGITHQHGAGTLDKIHHQQMAKILSAFCPYSSDTAPAGAIIFADPLVAKDLKDLYGFDTKEKLSQWLQENVQLTSGEFWNYSLVHSLTLPLARRGVEPFATWLTLPKETPIPRYPTPKGINIIVVGGQTNAFWQAGDFKYQGSAVVDQWL
jgi:hypothetical protein